MVKHQSDVVGDISVIGISISEELRYAASTACLLNSILVCPIELEVMEPHA